MAVTSVTGTSPINAAPTTGNVVLSIDAATDSVPGSMSAADKTKLDGMTAGAAVASVTGTAPIVSSGGTTPAISIVAATDSVPGSMSAADKTKLDAILAGAVSGIPAWTPLASGGTATVPSNTSAAYVADTTGSATTVQFPASGNCTDGQLVSVKGIGATATANCTLTPGAGTNLEDPNTPGTVGTGAASFIIRNILGFSVTYIYQATGTRWLIRGN